MERKGKPTQTVYVHELLPALLRMEQDANLWIIDTSRLMKVTDDMKAVLFFDLQYYDENGQIKKLQGINPTLEGGIVAQNPKNRGQNSTDTEASVGYSRSKNAKFYQCMHLIGTLFNRDVLRIMANIGNYPAVAYYKRRGYPLDRICLPFQDSYEKDAKTGERMVMEDPLGRIKFNYAKGQDGSKSKDIFAHRFVELDDDKKPVRIITHVSGVDPKTKISIQNAPVNGNNVSCLFRSGSILQTVALFNNTISQVGGWSFKPVFPADIPFIPSRGFEVDVGAETGIDLSGLSSLGSDAASANPSRYALPAPEPVDHAKAIDEAASLMPAQNQVAPKQSFAPPQQMAQTPPSHVIAQSYQAAAPSVPQTSAPTTFSVPVSFAAPSVPPTF